MAEILIVLGIIGIIAEMTIPTLMQSVGEREVVSKLKKDYTVISNAYNLIKEDEGTYDSWGTGDMSSANTHIIIGNMFKEQLKFSVNCIGKSKDEVISKCGDFEAKPEEDSRAILSDGTLIAFRGWSPDCSWHWGNSGLLTNVCGYIAVDINGLKNPNVAGKDRFDFLIAKDGIVPWGTVGQIYYKFPDYCNKNVGKNLVDVTIGGACTAWIIYNENMDYLHCDDLSWTGKTRCD
ncbi:hypothetical protein KBA27_02065 [bacterium]|nr:hypothetical protein [bacterium]